MKPDLQSLARQAQRRARAPLWAPLALVASMGFSQAASADTIVAFMKAARQGVLQGEVAQRGREGSTLVRVLDLGHEVPRDAATGQATGRKRFKPVTFLHDGSNKMAVQLSQALANNELLQDVTIQVWTPPARGAGAGAGVEVQAMTFKFTNALLAHINYVTVPTTPAPHPGMAGSQLMQEVSFTYQRLEITDHQSGAVTVLDLALPNQ